MESYCLGRLVGRFVTKLLVEEHRKRIDKDLSVITCYIDKISSPVLDDVFKRGMHFDINIPRLSVRGLHVLTILTKYHANVCR